MSLYIVYIAPVVYFDICKSLCVLCLLVLMYVNLIIPVYMRILYIGIYCQLGRFGPSVPMNRSAIDSSYTHIIIIHILLAYHTRRDRNLFYYIYTYTYL